MLSYYRNGCSTATGTPAQCGPDRVLNRGQILQSVRNGPDQLGMALLVTSFVIQIAIPLTGLTWLIYLSYGLYILFLFRRKAEH